MAQHETIKTAERVTVDAFRSFPGYAGAVYDREREVARCDHDHRDEAAAWKCAEKLRRSYLRKIG